MGLFDFINDIIFKKRSDLATKLLKETMGIDPYNRDERACDIRWYSDGRPFVLIVYKCNGTKLARREFYEFYNKKWDYIGYMDRKCCLDFYWRIKGKDMFRFYGRNIRNDNDQNQVDNVVYFELDEYFKYYKQLVNRALPPMDGAERRFGEYHYNR